MDIEETRKFMAAKQDYNDDEMVNKNQFQLIVENIEGFMEEFTVVELIVFFYRLVMIRVFKRVALFLEKIG